MLVNNIFTYERNTVMKNVIVETSARHIHVSAADLAVLFGADHKLTNKKESSEIPYEQIKDRLYQMAMSEKQRAAYTSKINQLKIMFPVDIF